MIWRKIYGILLLILMFLLVGCITPKAIFVHSRYHEIRPSLISILPLQDHRTIKKSEIDDVSKSDIDRLNMYNMSVMANYFKKINRYRYEFLSEVIDGNPKQVITAMQIKNVDENLLLSLGKPSSRWILIPAVTYMDKSFTGKYTKVRGYLFDKVRGVLIWEGQGGNALDSSAFVKMIESLPVRR